MEQPNQADVQGALAAMDQRIKRLETQVFGQTAPSPAPPPVVPPATPIPAPPAEDTSQPPKLPVPDPTPVEPPTPPRPPVEINWGKVLNWSGIAFLVLGAIFGLMYSWEYLGPWFKVGGGLALSGGLIFLGERLSRRDTNQWYGQGVMAGGWSLAYFIVYAMQNVTGLQVINNPVLDCTLLVALAGGCMTHAMRKRSEYMAILSTLLAFLTISLSSVTEFTVVASAVLVIGVSAVTARMKWQKVLAASVLGSYLTYAFFTQPQIVASAASASAGLWLSAGFLVLFWLAHNAVAYLLSDSEEQPHVVSAVTVLNALAFLGLGLYAMGDAGMESWRWLFLFGTGAAYLGATPFYAARNKVLPLITSLLGLAAVSAAVPLKLNPDATNTIWLIESALLVWAGLRFKQISFRWFAVALTALLAFNVQHELFANTSLVHIFSWTVEWRVLLGTLAAAVFASSAYLYSRPQFGTELRKYEALGANRFYFLLATMVLWSMPAAIAGDTTRSLFWLLEGGVILFLTRRSDDFLKHIATGAFFAAAVVSVLADYSVLNVWAATGVLAFTAAAGLSYRFDDDRAIKAGDRQIAYHVYMLAAMAASLFYTVQLMGFAGASTMLALLAALFIGVSLLLRDRTLTAASGASLVVVALSTWFNQPDWTWLNVLPALLVGYGASALAGLLAARGGLAGSKFTGDEWTVSKDAGRAASNLLGVGTSVLLTLVFTNLLSGPMVSVAWALEGLALLAVGFGFNMKLYEKAGLAMFALLAVRVLFWDFADASTPQRILSFMVTGAVFLAGSYAFAWFRKNKNTPTDNNA